MSKKKDEIKLTATEKVAQKAEGWIESHAKLLAIIGAALVVLVIALVIIFNVVGNNKEKTASALTAVEKSYNELYTLDSESDEYKAALADFKTEAEALVKGGLKTYEGAKAALLLGDIAFYENDYQTALNYYSDVMTAQSKTYLFQVASMNAAACKENLGDIQGALDIYNRLWDSFGREGFFGSRALFNAARLYEELGQIDIAKATYEQVVGEYGELQSEYANLATSRLAQLN